MSTSLNPLDKVRAELEKYEHPLFTFAARQKGAGVEVIIDFRDLRMKAEFNLHTYYFEMHPRDLDHPQFEWTFQRQLYDCMHDYLMEMFTRTPQERQH